MNSSILVNLGSAFQQRSLFIPAEISNAQESGADSDVIRCNEVYIVPKRVVGRYSANDSPLILTFGGITRHEREGGELDVEVKRIDGESVFYLDLSELNALIEGAEVPNMELDFTGPEEPDWQFPDDPRRSALTQEELALTALGGKFGISDVPRLSGSAEGTASDLSVTHWVRLAVLGNGLLFGT